MSVEIHKLSLRLQGAMRIIGDRVPTKEEWTTLKDMVEETVAAQVLDRLTADAFGYQLPLIPPTYPGLTTYYGKGSNAGTVTTTGLSYSPQTVATAGAVSYDHDKYDKELLKHMHDLCEKAIAKQSEDV